MQAYELIEMNPEKMYMRRDAHAKSLYTGIVHRTGFVTENDKGLCIPYTYSDSE